MDQDIGENVNFLFMYIVMVRKNRVFPYYKITPYLSKMCVVPNKSYFYVENYALFPLLNRVNISGVKG